MEFDGIKGGKMIPRLALALMLVCGLALIAFLVYKIVEQSGAW